MKTEEIAIVIVLFNPNEEEKDRIIALSDSYYGAIVDNSARRTFKPDIIGHMKYIPNNENLGIAEAQNIGIKEVIKNEETKFVVLLDQDSNIKTDYPELISREFVRISSSVSNLALLGPTVLHIKGDLPYKSILHKDVKADNGFIQRRDVISSGSCIPVGVLRTVGLNEGRLFIDFVDFEWCWRAESKGFVCGITKNVTISHHVGEKDLHIGKYQIIISAPFRYFYQYRNYLWLIRRKYVPRQWKIANGIKYFLRFFYLPFRIKEGFKTWRFMLKGIKAGLR